MLKISKKTPQKNPQNRFTGYLASNAIFRAFSSFFLGQKNEEFRHFISENFGKFRLFLSTKFWGLFVAKTPNFLK